MQGRIAYRQQFTRCGKERCRKCKEGEGHGPYWYAYWSENGRTKSKYIGVRPPPELETTQLEAPSMQEGLGTTPGTHQGSHYMSQSPTQYGVASVGARGDARPLPTPVLRVYLLGQFRVEHRDGNEWQVIDSQAWQHRRARSLLGCLLSNPGHRLSREQIMKLLWPNLDRDVAANRLNGAVHELRHILEPDIERAIESQMLRFERDMLELANSSQLWVDAEAFERLLNKADATVNTEQTERLLEEAAALYKGSYLLEELYSEWAAQRRDALQQQWINLLLKLANLRAARGSLLEAIEALDQLRATDPANETALQRLMVYLTQLHRRGEALRIYRQHVAILKRDYECDPLPETRTLYTMLRQGRIPDEYLTPLEATHPITTIGNSQASPTSASPANSTEGAIAFLRPAWRPQRHYRYPLLGRHQELKDMRRVLSTFTSPEIRREDPHFLLLISDPGIGKTRLAEELSLEAYTQDWIVAWSGASEQESTTPYSPWTTLLRILLLTPNPASSDGTALNQPNISYLSQLQRERLSVLLPELASPVPALAGKQPNDHKQERLQLWETIQALFFTLCQIHPLLLVIDDLQWADDDSIDLLGYLLHHLHEERILLVGTCQDQELADTPALFALLTDLQRKQALVRLPIQPLAETEIAKLLAHLPHDVAQDIQALAAGNPFFATVLARQAEQFSSQAIQTLPTAITTLFEGHLSKLSSDCRIFIEKAAQFGETFELSQLLLLADEQTENVIFDLLEEALHAKILREEGTGSHITYHFWHPLLVRYLHTRNMPY